MPELSRFFGIIIRMFYSDDEPAHFHAIYGVRPSWKSTLCWCSAGRCRAGRWHSCWNGLRCIASNCVMIGSVRASDKLLTKSILSIEVKPYGPFAYS